MSWLTGLLKEKQPYPKVGMRVDLKTGGYAVVASGEITKVFDDKRVQIRVSWSTTSLYGIDFLYEINLQTDPWTIVREDSW